MVHVPAFTEPLAGFAGVRWGTAVNITYVPTDGPTRVLVGTSLWKLQLLDWMNSPNLLTQVDKQLMHMQ